MIRKCSCLIMSLLCFVLASAHSTDTIHTVYRNAEFVTTCSTQVYATERVSNEVVDDFLYQTRYKLDGLFTWALKGLNLRGEKNDLFIMNFKSTAYNKQTGVIHALGDVTVPYIITFDDIAVDSKMEKVSAGTGSIRVNINVLYSDAFLKKTWAIFTVRKLDANRAIYQLETHVKFGWFFDIFITQKRFKSIMEWRFMRLLNNLADEAQRRQKAKMELRACLPHLPAAGRGQVTESVCPNTVFENISISNIEHLQSIQ